MNMKTAEQWRTEFEQAEELAGDWPKAFAGLLEAVRPEFGRLNTRREAS